MQSDGRREVGSEEEGEQRMEKRRGKGSCRNVVVVVMGMGVEA